MEMAMLTDGYKKTKKFIKHQIKKIEVCGNNIFNSQKICTHNKNQFEKKSFTQKDPQILRLNFLHCSD